MYIFCLVSCIITNPFILDIFEVVTYVIIYRVFLICLQQIDKAANALKNSVELFRVFIDGIDRWLANNRERALKIFRTVDVSGTGKITHDQFKAGTSVVLLKLPIFGCQRNVTTLSSANGMAMVSVVRL